MNKSTLLSCEKKLCGALLLPQWNQQDCPYKYNEIMRGLLSLRILLASIGCSNLVVPEGATVSRDENNDDDVTITCQVSMERWHVRCQNGEWVGDKENNCSSKGFGAIKIDDEHRQTLRHLQGCCSKLREELREYIGTAVHMSMQTSCPGKSERGDGTSESSKMNLHHTPSTHSLRHSLLKISNKVCFWQFPWECC
ncbi:hypothetical protein HELRODRAFT_175145 [Helobdella robusta]|uniref:Sushi domain-containing protein n=1 Tax=Helobdella robusta TaxID=6412 RepID=T1F8X0_HELRO|nr:hypothetical protein HELRODRAFT_175145 [Helobdella robusta]ESO01115.1 hypothetical protein HELRODRAFT_175145 [Helobdella robusta]